jgi:hypothetical protein
VTRWRNTGGNCKIFISEKGEQQSQPALAQTAFVAPASQPEDAASERQTQFVNGAKRFVL